MLNIDNPKTDAARFVDARSASEHVFRKDHVYLGPNRWWGYLKLIRHAWAGIDKRHGFTSRSPSNRRAPQMTAVRCVDRHNRVDPCCNHCNPLGGFFGCLLVTFALLKYAPYSLSDPYIAFERNLRTVRHSANSCPARRDNLGSRPGPEHPVGMTIDEFHCSGGILKFVQHSARTRKV